MSITGGKIPKWRISWPNEECVYYILPDSFEFSLQRYISVCSLIKVLETNCLLIPLQWNSILSDYLIESNGIPLLFLHILNKE